jgi:hypothetical protein
MVVLGWQPADEPGSLITPSPARFYRPLPDENQAFVATAQFGFQELSSARPQASRVVRVEGHLGVTAPAVERLLTMLDAQHRNAASEEDLDTLLSPPCVTAVEVTTADDLVTTLQPLVAAVSAHIDTIRHLASLSAWLRDVQGDPDGFKFEIEVVPTALVAFGRPDEARRALERYTGQDTSQAYKAFAKRLTRFIDSDTDIPDPGDVNLHRPPGTSQQAGSSGLERARMRRIAVKGAAQRGHGQSREQRKTILEDALAQQGLTESPLWIESQLDAGKRGQWSNAVRVARDIVGGAAKLARGRVPQDPPFLTVPEYASDLSHRRAAKWLAVSLDPGAHAFLEKVSHEGASRFGRTVLVKPCLQWSASDASEDGQAFVSIGEQRVGKLSAAEMSASFKAALGEPDSDGPICVSGRLTTGLGQTGFLLEVGEPR